MKHFNRWMSLALALAMLGAMVVLSGVGYAESDSSSGEVYFDPVMIQKVDLSMEEFTATDDMRALFAFLLSYEFSNQEPNYSYDFTQPIYVALEDPGIASLAMGLEDGYMIVLYSNLTDPVTAAYLISEDATAAIIKSVLDANNDTVWEVSAENYFAQGQALVDALNSSEEE